MRFTLTDEQRGVGRSLDDLLSAADTPAVIRAWSAGDHDPGLKLVRRLTDLGVNGLLVPDSAGGLGATSVEMVVALEALGRHAVPGPWVETVFLTQLVAGRSELDTFDEVLSAIAEGTEVVSVAAPPWTPYALDADLAHRVLLVADGGLHVGRAGELVASVDPARRLFARPLVYGAAVTGASRDASAAKVATSEAAYRAARIALQVHGAIGYTAEYDLGLWLLKVRALVAAWGSPSAHRARVLSSLVEED